MIFPHYITLERFVSTDLYGEVTYEPPEKIPATLDYVIKDIRDFRGNTILTSAWIALPPDTKIGLRDKITMPDGTAPYIGTIGPTWDYRRNRVHYIEVYVARARPGEGSL